MTGGTRTGQFEPALDGSYGRAPQGHRLPASTRMGGVTLQVSDLTRSRDFYQQTLGFHVIAAGHGRVLLGAHGGTDPLIELVENRAGRSLRSARSLGLYHIAILLPSRSELGRFFVHLQSLGIRAGAADHLVSEALYLQDPDDLGIEVYADRAHALWRRNGRELLMASDPIDVRGLLAVAGDTAWAGMPAGTTVGHVHLHVGDLELAARFFGDGVGFDQMVWSYPGALFMAAGGYHHHLGTNTWAGARAQPAAPDDPRLLEWSLLLPTTVDVQSAAENLQSLGHPITPEGADVVVRDPWGTQLRLRRERP